MSRSIPPTNATTAAPDPRKPVYRVRHLPFKGYVVVNSNTNMVVVGPFALKEVAERAAEVRNAGRG